MAPADLDRVADLLEACSHYFSSDLPMFVQGYCLVSDAIRPGADVLEICCGRGQLAAAMAKKHPEASFVATDRSRDLILEAQEKHSSLENLKFVAEDIRTLESYSSGSFDLIFGQATLHHMAHDIGWLSAELFRLLKPGGTCVFVNEPLGTSYLVAAVRAMRVTKNRWPDETNLFPEIFEHFGEPFREIEIWPYNGVGYFAKLFPEGACNRLISSACKRVDNRLLKMKWQLAANINLAFHK